MTLPARSLHVLIDLKRELLSFASSDAPRVEPVEFELSHEGIRAQKSSTRMRGARVRGAGYQNYRRKRFR